jgi:FkbM family methyltransferase
MAEPGGAPAAAEREDRRHERESRRQPQGMVLARERRRSKSFLFWISHPRQQLRWVLVSIAGRIGINPGRFRRRTAFAQWLLSPVCGTTVEAGGFEVEVDRRDTLALGFCGRYEPDVEHAINKLLPPGGVFVDVGANLGWFSLIASRKASLVVALEPELDNFALLARNLARNGCTNVIPLRLAAGSEATEVMLELDPTNLGGHRISGRRQQISAVRVDQLTNALGCPPDLVKIDVEGYEPEVVEGLGDIRCDLIVEFNPAALHEQVTSPRHSSTGCSRTAPSSTLSMAMAAFSYGPSRLRRARRKADMPN